jgi:hypothetical protein
VVVGPGSPAHSASLDVICIGTQHVRMSWRSEVRRLPRLDGSDAPQDRAATTLVCYLLPASGVAKAKSERTGCAVAKGRTRSGWFPVAAWMLLASFPPALWFVHERIASLPTTTPLVLMNYDAFVWLGAWRAACAQRRKAASATGMAVTIVAVAGLVLSGLYLVTLIGLCGPAVLFFLCHA